MNAEKEAGSPSARDWTDLALLPGDRELFSKAISNANPTQKEAAAIELLCRLSCARWWDVAGGYPQEPPVYHNCPPAIRKQIIWLAEELAVILRCEVVSTVTGGSGDLWLLSFFAQAGICGRSGAETNALFLADIRDGMVTINGTPVHVLSSCADVYGLEGTICYDFALVTRGERRFFVQPDS